MVIKQIISYTFNPTYIDIKSYSNIIIVTTERSLNFQFGIVQWYKIQNPPNLITKTYIVFTI